MPTYNAANFTVGVTNRRPYVFMNPTDFPIINSTKNVAGTVYDTNGAIVSGATVKLFRQSDDFLCATQTSDVVGHYAFVRDADDPYQYWVMAYTLGATPQVHGTSDRSVVPV